jgi:hypothetical protein
VLQAVLAVVVDQHQQLQKQVVQEMLGRIVLLKVMLAVQDSVALLFMLQAVAVEVLL